MRDTIYLINPGNGMFDINRIFTSVDEAYAAVLTCIKERHASCFTNRQDSDFIAYAENTARRFISEHLNCYVLKEIEKD